MAHEITKTDGLVLHLEEAWHGLGTVVQDAPTPREALKIAGMDWDVVQYPLIARASATEGYVVPTHQANYRADTKTCLGIVGAGYTPIQNTAVADFCEALAEADDVVKVESAGSIRGGAKIWFLLKGESFSVRAHKDDEIAPYICVSNGHDGMTAFRATPTTVRVVCSNTLHMVIPKAEKEGRLSISKTKPGTAFVCHHTVSIKERIEQAKAALGLYNKALVGTKAAIDHLAACDVNSDMVKEFFLRCYVNDFGPIPAKPTTPTELNTEWKARQAFMAVEQRFETEKGLAGTNLWNAMNAYTGWLQNENLPNVKDADKAMDQKNYSKLFGTDATRAHHALSIALTMAG